MEEYTTQQAIHMKITLMLLTNVGNQSDDGSCKSQVDPLNVWAILYHSPIEECYHSQATDEEDTEKRGLWPTLRKQ